MGNHTYVTKNAPSFQMRMGSNDRLLKFKDRQLVLNDEDPSDAECILELDALLSKRPDLSAQITKVDIAEAERIVREHQRMLREQRGTYTGMATSAENLRLAQAALIQRDMEASKAGQKLEGDDTIQLTESASGQVVRDSGEGFVPDPVAENKEPSTEPVRSASEILSKLVNSKK